LRLLARVLAYHAALVKPTLAAIAIFTFMASWNEFMLPLIYLQDQRLYPLALGLFAFNVEAGITTSMLMAASLLMITPSSSSSSSPKILHPRCHADGMKG